MIRFLQEHAEVNIDRLLQFVEEIAYRCSINPNFRYNIYFSYECSFSLHKLVNRYNCRYRIDTNSPLYRGCRTKIPENVNDVGAILGNFVIERIFLQNNLTGQIYINLFQDKIVVLIKAVIAEDNNKT